MAWRIGENIVRGEIDNRLPGIVHGTLYVEGMREPVKLELDGNCEPDLAGRRLIFQNLMRPLPMTGQEGFAAWQCGEAGTMTANRMLRIPTIPPEEVTRCLHSRIPIPTRWSESLHLEWFGANGRVLIEGSSFRCELTPPAWRSSADDREWSRRIREEDVSIAWDDDDGSLFFDDEPWSETLAPRNGKTGDPAWLKSLRHEFEVLGSELGGLLRQYLKVPTTSSPISGHAPISAAKENERGQHE